MAIGGYQAEFSVYLTGLDTDDKAKSFQIMSRRMVDASKLDCLDFQLYGSPKENPTSQLQSTLQLRVIAQAREPGFLTPGHFLGPLMSNQLSGFPGLTANFDYRTAAPKLFCTYFPGLVHRSAVQQVVFMLSGEDGEDALQLDVDQAESCTPVLDLPRQKDFQSLRTVPLDSFGPTTRVPLGHAVFARSGDKGANVNVGFFFPSSKNSVRDGEAYTWLSSFLTTDRLRGKSLSSY